MMSPVWLAMTASPIASQLIVDVVSEAVQAVAEAMVDAMSMNWENLPSIDVKGLLPKVGMDLMREATLSPHIYLQGSSRTVLLPLVLPRRGHSFCIQWLQVCGRQLACAMPLGCGARDSDACLGGLTRRQEPSLMKPFYLPFALTYWPRVHQLPSL